MHSHIKVLGIVFLVCAGFLAFFAVAVPLGLGLVSALIGHSGDPDAATGMAVMGLVGTGLGIFFAMCAAVWGICGYGILKHKSWARIFAIILCAMMLIKLPFGTAIGIYGLWIMLNKKTEAIFATAPAV